MPSSEAALIVGMAVGDRSLFDSELDTVTKNTGLTHLTAVSGSNCAIIVGTIIFTLRLCRVQRDLSAVIASGVLLYFVILVRPDPSIVQASCMAIIALAALSFGRQKTHYLY